MLKIISQCSIKMTLNVVITLITICSIFSVFQGIGNIHVVAVALFICDFIVGFSAPASMPQVYFWTYAFCTTRSPVLNCASVSIPVH